MRLLVQSISILVALGAVLFINLSPLSNYIPPILAFLIVLSMISIILRQRQAKRTFSGSNLEIFSVLLISLLTIFATGGLNSNLFFITYLLFLGLVFAFDPRTVFVLLAGLIVIFAPSISQGDISSNLIKLGSLALISPIAYFLGSELERRGKNNRNLKDASGKIIEDAETLAKHENDEIKLDEIEDIEENAFKIKKELDRHDK